MATKFKEISEAELMKALDEDREPIDWSKRCVYCGYPKERDDYDYCSWECSEAHVYDRWGKEEE